MKHEHTPRRLEHIVNRGWDYTIRYLLLYLAVNGNTRVLSACIGAITVVICTLLGNRF
ncbi:hypothetical protein SKC41_30215 [Mycobacterium sp. 050128]|uniref:hypothetical protein n=1 Tax=Mycobacterium sp. 050128 TaxID=3096112 RepID=UPI002ED9DCF6